MSILGFLVFVLVLGLATWLIVTYVPMPQPIKTVLVVCVVIIIVLVLLNATGMLGGSLGNIPRVR